MVRVMMGFEKAIAVFGAVFLGGLLRLLIVRWCEKRSRKTGAADGSQLPPSARHHCGAISQQSRLQKPLDRIEIQRRSASASRDGCWPHS
jgi:hypothetical protein